MININKNGYKTFSFGEIASNNTERVEPKDTDLSIYVGLEHLDPECIHINRKGIPADVKGTKFRVFPGDIIFGKRRAYQRKAGLVDFDGICSAHALVVRANPEVILPELFPFFIHSDNFMHRAVDVSEGSLSPTIKWKILAEERFKLPPQPEQKRLADLLWSVDGVIESYSLLLTKLVTTKNALLKHKHYDEGNKLQSISAIADINPKVSRSSINKKTKVSFIAMADISEEGCIINKRDKKYSDVQNGFTPFEEKDILFAKITPCMENGKGAIANGLTNSLGFGSTEFHVIRPKKPDDCYYLYSLSRMYYFRRKAEQLMTGSAGQKRVPVDFFDYYKVCFPDEVRRKKLGLQLLRIDEEIERVRKIIGSTNNIQQDLINQIFF